MAGKLTSAAELSLESNRLFCYLHFAGAQMLDLPTLLVGYCTTTVILSLALLLAARSQQRFPGLELWSLGGLLIGTVPLQLFIQPHAIQPGVIVSITLAIVGGMACISAGMARYTATPFRRHFYAGALIFCAGFSVLAAVLELPLSRWVALVALTVSVMAAETGLQLLRNRQLLEMPTHRVTAAFFFLLSGGSLLRAGRAFFLGMEVPRIGEAVVYPLGMLALQALHTALGMCFLVMVWARLDRELQAHVGTLEEQVLRDPLTGALNRRGLWDFAEPVLETARSYGQPVSVVCLDIDYFKRVNDTYGHAIGDEVLKPASAPTCDPATGSRGWVAKSSPWSCPAPPWPAPPPSRNACAAAWSARPFPTAAERSTSPAASARRSCSSPATRCPPSSLGPTTLSTKPSTAAATRFAPTRRPKSPPSSPME